MNKINLILLTLTLMVFQSNAQEYRLQGNPLTNVQGGSDVSIEGDIAAVGVPAGFSLSTTSTDYLRTGIVDVYEFNGTEWVLEQVLVALDSAEGDLFGLKVKVFQNKIFVGAYGHDQILGDVIVSNSGAVYVFEKIDDSWVQSAKITQSNPKENDEFGVNFDVGVNQLFIGKPEYGKPSGSPAGVIHVFKYTAGNWIEKAVIENDVMYQDSTIQGNWGIGYSDGLLATTVLSTNDQMRTGIVHIYQLIEDQWQLQDTIKSPTGSDDDYFGGKVSIHKGKILISAPGESSDTIGQYFGAAYLFEQSNDQWIQTHRFADVNAFAGNNFGASVALSDNQIYIGAIYQFDQSPLIEGEVFSYHFIDNNWRMNDVFEVSGNQGSNNFGRALSFDNNWLLVGAPRGFGLIGESYVFEIEPDSERFELNQGLNGNWYNPSTAGQGIFLDVKPELDYAYMGWFTYDTTLAADDEVGQIGAAGHRWVVGNGEISQSTQSITFDMFYAANGLFDDPQAVTLPETNPYGSMTMVFNDDCGSADVTYEIPSEDLFGAYSVIRPSAGSLDLCDAFAQGPIDVLPGDFDVSLNGHWFNPATQGQGLFVEQFASTDQAFMGWFTYDAMGVDNPVMSQVGADGQRWLVGSGRVNAEDPNVLDFDLLYSAGGLFDDSTTVTVEGADSGATLSIDFINCGQAQVSYDIPAEKISGAYDMVKLFTDSDQSCPADSQ